MRERPRGRGGCVHSHAAYVTHTQCCSLMHAPPATQSVRLFGLGMRYADILSVVEAEARNPDTLGRGYTCGVSNVGVFSPPADAKLAPKALRAVAGYYGTSHARSGVYCLLSSITVDGALCGCLQFTAPITPRAEAAAFRDGIAALLRAAAAAA